MGLARILHITGEPTGWIITIEREDSKVVISKSVPNDELEYGVDDALREARYQEQNLLYKR